MKFNRDELSALSYRLLSTLYISVLGCGDIELEVAKHCKNFGMTVYGMVTKLPNNRPNYVDKFFLPTNLPEFLKKSDYICNLLPKTEQTANMLSGCVLEKFREVQSIFINIGRGSVIDDDSLTNAIEKGWLKAVTLDVFNEEPLPRESKLWGFPNAFITPHVAGLSLDEEVCNWVYALLLIFMSTCSSHKDMFEYFKPFCNFSCLFFLVFSLRRHKIYLIYSFLIFFFLFSL